MRSFPASIPLCGRTIIVSGNGELAAAKVRLFENSPARLKWFTGTGSDCPPSATAHTADVYRREPTRRDLRGATILFIAGGSEREVLQLRRWARQFGVLVNVIDAPARSDFQTPAIIDRDGVVVSVATAGAAPVLSVDIRAAIETLLPSRIGILADLARDLRGTVRAVFDRFDDRRRFWETALRGPARDLALTGDKAGARRELLKSLNAPQEASSGIVHLVGAGPGDPDLLTLKAARLLREADVIVFDRLVSKGVIDLARRDAIRIDVGKRKGHHPVPQDAISDILIDHARRGYRVVRLKGGDPFVFGRGGEELEALRAAGISAYVTPGITAAAAAAASTGIPLTHRDHAQSVTLASGVVKADGPDADYAALAAPNHTVVFYMGVGAAADIQAKMLDAGRSPDTPLAIVERASTPQERHVTGRLDQLSKLVRAENITGPSIILIGESAALAARQTPAVLEQSA